MYKINNSGPRIDPWGIPNVNIQKLGSFQGTFNGSRLAAIVTSSRRRKNQPTTQKQKCSSPGDKVFVNRLIFRCNLWSFYYLYIVCLMYFYTPNCWCNLRYSFYLRRNKDWLVGWLALSIWTPKHLVETTSSITKSPILIPCFGPVKCLPRVGSPPYRVAEKVEG